MFLDTDIIRKKSFLLNEADDEEPTAENDSKDEPTEKDAEMDLEKEADVNNDDSNNNEDDVGDESEDSMNGEADGSEDSDSGEGSGDDSMNQEPSENPEEAMKKRRLFKDYKKLFFIMEEFINSLAFINYQNMTENEKKIFNYIEDKIKEEYEKVSIIIKEQFSVLSYEKLLKLYLYSKMSLKNFTEIMKNFIE